MALIILSAGTFNNPSSKSSDLSLIGASSNNVLLNEFTLIGNKSLIKGKSSMIRIT